MKKPALRRASKSTAVFVIAAALFVAGMAGSTLAYFDGQTDNVAVISGAYVVPPVTVTTLGSLTGPIQTIKWSQPGLTTNGVTTNGVNNYEIRLTNMGTAAVACPANRTTTVTQTVLTTTTSAGVTITTTATAAPVITNVPVTYPETVATLAAPALTAPATVSTTDNGSFVCFQVAGAQSIGGWYSPAGNANATAVRVGLWPNTVALTNHATPNKIAATDTILVTYNQNVNASATGLRVCVLSSGGTIILGDTSGSACSASDGYTIGKITGLTIGANLTFTNAAISATGSIATVTLTGASGATVTASESGTGTYTSATTNSNVTTPGSPSIPPCTISGCTKATSGTF
jgi:hypothetical protein